jgi:hypothetical protein
MWSDTFIGALDLCQDCPGAEYLVQHEHFSTSDAIIGNRWLLVPRRGSDKGRRNSNISFVSIISNLADDECNSMLSV